MSLAQHLAGIVSDTIDAGNGLITPTIVSPAEYSTLSGTFR